MARSHEPADLADHRFPPSKWAQFYCDTSRQLVELYRARLDTAIDRLAGREDAGASWARAFIVQELTRIDARLKRQSSAAIELEKARDALSAAHKELDSAASAYRDALTVEDLTAASAVLEIAKRRARIAEEAFVAAAKAAHIPRLELRFEDARMRACGEGVTPRMAKAAARSDGWDAFMNKPGWSNQIDGYFKNDWNPDRMVFEIVAETEFREDPSVSEAFDFRFTRWARSQGIALEAAE